MCKLTGIQIDGQVRSRPRILVGVVASIALLLLPSAAHAARSADRSVQEVEARVGDAARSARSADSAPASAPKANSIFWGAYWGTQFTGQSVPWDMQGLEDFETHDAAGKGMSIVPFYLAFNDCDSGVSDCTPYVFPSDQMGSIRADGSIPMVSWGSYNLADSSRAATPQNAYDSKFTLASVISGEYDSYIRSFARSAKRWGHPFFLRFDWEMNGNWYAWGNRVGTNTAKQFVAAWRHVYDIFQQVGARNATWVWCPNAGELGDLKALYPGNAYVGWTCADLYNFGLTYQGTGWDPFSKDLRPTYNAITNHIAPHKPFMLGEFGSVSAGGSQAAWISTALSETPVEFPRVKAMVLFDDDPNDIGLSLTNTSSIKAFATGIRSPVYLWNQFSKAKRIPVP